jgi:hypothetical protein
VRESWRLRQINERIDAQWCLLKQRVWLCNTVSELRNIPSLVYILTVVVHLESVFAARFVVSSCRVVVSLLR